MNLFSIIAAAIVFTNISFANQIAKTTPVLHFDPKKLIWTNQTIPNISDIDKIYSAGSYAWAISKNSEIAFFNGEKWMDGLSISGITKIINFYPEYPLIGKTPFAWVLGRNDAYDYFISYFNGSSWSGSQIINMQYPATVSLQVSGGYAWFITDNNNDGNVRIKIVNNPDSAKWSNVILPIQEVFTAKSFGDQHHYLYVLGKTIKYENAVLIRVDAEGSYKIVRKDLINVNSLFFVRDNYLFLTYGSWDNKKLLYSNDYGESWQIRKMPANNDIIYQNNFQDGVFCTDKLFSRDKEYSCTNFNESSPREFIFDLSKYLHDNPSAEFTYCTANNGLWLLTNKKYQSVKPFVFHYDVISNQFVDTKIANLVEDLNGLEFGQFRMLNKEKLMICGYKKNRKYVLYYNGKQWIENRIQLNNACRFNVSGNSIDWLYTIDENLWIY